MTQLNLNDVQGTLASISMVRSLFQALANPKLREVSIRVADSSIRIDGNTMKVPPQALKLLLATLQKYCLDAETGLTDSLKELVNVTATQGNDSGQAGPTS